MEHRENVQSNKEIPERPTGLGILLMLTSIASFFGLFGNLTMLFTAMSEQNMDSLLEAMSMFMKRFGYEKEQIDTLVSILSNHGAELTLSGSIVNLMTIIAVVQMFRFRKAGFHIYVGARILEVIMPVIIAGPLLFDVMGILLSGLFIYFYSRYLKLMN